MNTATLSVISMAILSDLNDNQIIAKLDQIIAALQASINQPNQNTENAKSAALKDFYSANLNSSFDDFPRTWRSALQELELVGYMGSELAKMVKNTFSGNELLPVDVVSQLESIAKHLRGKHGAFTKLSQGLNEIGLSGEMLEEGRAELSVLVPTEVFSGELGGFGKEVNNLNSIVRFFSEVATSSRESIELKQLSTTDPYILVGVAVDTLRVILEHIDLIQNVIIGTLTLREAYKSSKDAGFDKKTLDIMQEQVTTQIQSGLDEIKDALVKGLGDRDGRENELAIEAEKVLEDLATRIDHGYQIEGDVGQLSFDEEDYDEEAYDEEDVAEMSAKKEEIEGIKALAQRVREIDIPDEPVLALPPPSVDGDDE